MHETLGRETLGQEAPGIPTTAEEAPDLASDTHATTAHATLTRLPQPPQPARPDQSAHAPNKLVVTGAVILCVVIFVALVAHLLATTNSSTDRTGAIGAPAPNFTITVWNGSNGSSATSGTTSTLSLASLQGRPIVLDFWSPTSLQSQQMAPTFEQLSKQYAMFGVAFVGVAVETPTSDGQAFMRKYGLTFPNGADPDGAIATAYALPGLPDAVFINNQGVIVDTLVGLNTPDELDYIIRQDLLDGIPPLPTPQG